MLLKLIQILQLPERCMVNKKITKAFFKRNFDLTTAETKLLDNFTTVIQMYWLASIKPENANIITSRHEQLVYEEVVIIAVQTGEDDYDKVKQKIAELIQKYIPYHILLFIYNSRYFVLNACTKRINQNDASRRTVEKHYFTKNIINTSPTEIQKSFMKSLAFSELDKQNLKTFYDAYISRIIAFQASDLTGMLTVRKYERSIQDVQYLENIARLHSEILTLQNQAIKETQLKVQVQLNAEILERRKEIKKFEKLISS